MKKFLSFVLILNMLGSASKTCALPTKAGTAEAKKVVEIKEKKTKTSCKVDATGIIKAVITASGTIIGFYILGHYISTLDLKPNINVNLDQNTRKSWLQNVASTIAGFAIGNIKYIYSFFRRNGAAPPPAG